MFVELQFKHVDNFNRSYQLRKLRVTVLG